MSDLVLGGHLSFFWCMRHIENSRVASTDVLHLSLFDYTQAKICSEKKKKKKRITHAESRANSQRLCLLMTAGKLEGLTVMP